MLIALLTPKCPPPIKRAPTWKGKFLELDPLGFLLIGTSLTCLLLAIQFGGKEYSWNSELVIALFVIAGVFGLSFVGFAILRGENSTIPPSIITQRSILASTMVSLGLGSATVLFAFYLPIWFQVVQNKSPEQSGISLIPLLLSIVFAVISSGIFASAVGYYVPSVIVGACVLIVGAGLISTWTANVSTGRLVGFQVRRAFSRLLSP